MKKLLITLIVLYPWYIIAQSFWNVAIDDSSYNKSLYKDSDLFQDSIILTSGFVNHASCRYHKLFAYNLSGERLWSIGGFHDLIFSDSNYIFTAGYSSIGDVAGNEQVVISKYNKYGDEIFSISYPEIPHSGFYFYPKSIDIAPDGTILISSANSIIKSNTEGEYILEYQLQLDSEINSVKSLNEDTYFIQTNSKLYKANNSFSLIDSIQFANTINNIIIENNSIYTLLETSLILLDTNFIITDTVVAEVQHYANVYSYNNNIWLQANVGDSIMLYNYTDLVLHETKTFPALVNNAKFIFSQNNYIFLGNSFTEQIGIYNFKGSDFDIFDVNLPNIELADFNIDNISIEYVALNDNDSLAIGYRFDAELTVTNSGNNTIATLAIFADLQGGTECDQNFFYQKFTGLNLLSGESQIFNIENIYQDGINNNQLCFQCIAPNSQLEILTDDNTLCKTFVINKIDSDYGINIQVYPNPFNDFIIVENPDSDIDFIDIIDINGKVIIRHKTTSNKETIHTNDIAAGTYIIRISAGNKISSGLFIKK